MIRSEGRWFFIFLVGQSNVNKISYKSFSLSNSDLIWIFISFELRLLLLYQSPKSTTIPECNLTWLPELPEILFKENNSLVSIRGLHPAEHWLQDWYPYYLKYHKTTSIHSKRSEYDPVNNSLSFVSQRLWVLLVRDCLQFLWNNLNILHLPPLSSGRPLMEPSLVVSLLSLVFFSRTGAWLEVQCRSEEDIKLNVSVISPDSVLLTWELTSLQDLQLEAVFSRVGRRWNIYFTNFSQTKLNKVVVVVRSQKVSVEFLLMGNV